MEKKKIISEISFAMAESTRKLMIDTLMNHSGEEIETVQDMRMIAEFTEEQLRHALNGLLNYFLNENETNN